MEISKELFYRYFNNESSEAEEKLLRQYLEASDENRKVYLRERKLFDATLLHHHADARNRVSLFHRARLVWGGIAAALVIGFISAYMLMNYNNQSRGINIVETDYGQMTQLTLSDRTHVHLNAHSKLSYPGLFASKARKVQVSGEAYFDVAPNKKKPFVVQTRHAEVRVLGTKFYVEDYDGSNESRITLMQGKVEVKAGNQTKILAPNQQAVISNGVIHVGEVHDFNTYRWKEGLICFRQQSLKEVMSTFEKYYGVKIRFSDGFPHTHTLVTGKFYIPDGVDYALNVLRKDIGFNYTRQIGERTIIIH